MKPIGKADRRVVNIADPDVWTPYTVPGAEGTSSIQLNPETERDVGFYIYRMEPGSSSTPHLHPGAEEFVIIEGEAIDNDGTVYRQGDVVWLGPGTEHSSYTKTGCVIAVYSEKKETPPAGE